MTASFEDEIRRINAMIGEARALLAAGEMPDLTGLTGEFDRLHRSIAADPPADSDSPIAAIEDIMRSLDGLARAIEDQRGAMTAGGDGAAPDNGPPADGKNGTA